MTQPASVFSDGMVRVDWVPVLADPENPALSELQALANLEMSCYFTDAGWAPNTAEDQAPDPRLCSTETYTGPGRHTTTIPTVYVTNPDDPTNDEAAVTLVDRSTGYYVERRGVAYDQAWAAGDMVNVYPVKLGVQNETPPTANTPLTITQMAYVRAPGTKRRVLVVAS